jgi:hypothetical protein
LKFAYADPPYLGLGKLYRDIHPNAMDCDDPEWHRALVERLCADYSDGWALSLHTPSLRTILPMCPADVRVLAWVKPFASFKRGVGLAYAWEPIILRGGRKRTRQDRTTRDWLAEPITLRRGFTGAKPARVVYWLLEALHAKQGDDIDDLFPGSGAVSRAIEEWKDARRAEPSALPLFA